MVFDIEKYRDAMPRAIRRGARRATVWDIEAIEMARDGRDAICFGCDRSGSIRSNRHAARETVALPWSGSMMITTELIGPQFRNACHVVEG